MIESQPIEKNPLGAWPAEGLEAVPQCPLCGSNHRELLHDHLSDTVFFCAPGTWTLWRCEGCGGGYLDPRPTPGSISLAYAKYYTHAPGTSSTRVNAIRSLARGLRNGYKNARWGTRQQPSIRRLSSPFARLTPGVAASVDGEDMRHLPRPASGRSVLDVGCGNGRFLGFAREAGWTVRGIDFDERAVATCRAQGLDVTMGGIDDLDAPAESFDAITVSHVIEHVHAPQALLSTCARLLKRGGYFWIETPNLDSLGHAHFGRHWRGLEPPRHLVLFTLETLTRALNDAGFQNIHPAPWRPQTLGTYASSSAMRRGDASPNQARARPLTRIHSLWDNFRLRTKVSDREFVTLTATRS